MWAGKDGAGRVGLEVGDVAQPFRLAESAGLLDGYPGDVHPHHAAGSRRLGCLARRPARAAAYVEDPVARADAAGGAEPLVVWACLGLEDLGEAESVVGVAQDRGHDHVPRRARRGLVPHALEQEQLGVGDLVGQRLPVPGREERVLRAVDDERRRPHLAEARPHVIGALQEPVVARARPPVGRARDLTARHLAHRVLIEAARPAYGR